MKTDLDNDLAVRVQELAALVSSAVRQKTVESFETLERQVNQFETFVRELQQARCADDARAAIRRLESNQALTDGDRQTIRSLVVGDAEQYLKQENNLNEWLNELQRLTDLMSHAAGSTSDGAIDEMRGIVKDAVRLLPNIRSYMEEKDRLNRFNAAFAELDDDNRRLLVDILREKISSTTR